MRYAKISALEDGESEDNRLMSCCMMECSLCNDFVALSGGGGKVLCESCYEAITNETSDLGMRIRSALKAKAIK